jgi:prepilin-type N-terminal cleavage/methylation domain-containing protein
MLASLYRRLRGGPRTDRGGFSLVEVLVVLMIISVGILPIAIVQHRARREVTESDHHTQAVTVAQAQLERIKGLGFGNAAADSGQVGRIVWNAQVTNVAFGMDRVEVTTSWSNHDGMQTLTIADLVSMR